MKAHTLYRHYDADGALLYVGITIDPGSRYRSHRAHGWSWWERVASTTYEHHASREAVRAAEVRAIKRERPQWNVQHNKKSNEPVLFLDDAFRGVRSWARIQEIESRYWPDIEGVMGTFALVAFSPGGWANALEYFSHIPADKQIKVQELFQYLYFGVETADTTDLVDRSVIL